MYGQVQFITICFWCIRVYVFMDGKFLFLSLKPVYSGECTLLLSTWLYNCTIMYMYNIYEMNQWIFIVLTWTSTVDTEIYCSYLTTSVCKSLFSLNYFNAWNALTVSIIEKYRYRYVLLCIYTKVNISVDLLATKTFILAFVVKCIYLSNPYFTGLKLSRPFTWV